MTWHVQWEPTAIDEAAGFLKNDPQTMAQLIRATDALAENPRPAGSTAWGTSHRRLRIAAWRVLYRIDAEAETLHIEHIGRRPLD
ncbi:type II toxin-antitoxin system RelE family toxin [Streptomyces sp. NPDC002754]